MGTVKKINDEYYIEFYARGLLYQQKAGRDLEQAKKFLEEVESKIHQGEMGTIVRDIEIAIFLKTFLEFAKVHHTPKTFKRYSNVIDHFNAFLENNLPAKKKLSEVTPFIIEQYLSYLKLQKVKPKLINFSLFLIRNIFDYAIKLEYLNDNPTLHARYLVQNSPNQKPLIIKNSLARYLLNQGTSLAKVYELLELKDIARVARYIPFARDWSNE